MIYNSTASKWEIQQKDHTTLSNIGTNTHAQIDTFISSKSQANGLCSLNANSQVPLNNIEQDMSTDLLINSLTGFVDKNSINNIGDNLLNFYNYSQNYPLTSLYANWITISVVNNSYRTNIDACYPVTFTKINYSIVYYKWRLYIKYLWIK